MSRHLSLSYALCLTFLAAACGEDKNYGEPLDDPLATQSALSAILNAQRLPVTTTNDSALLAVDGIGGNFNLMTGAKFNAENQSTDSRRALNAVDEACVELNGSTFTYRDCAYGNAVVNGTVRIEGETVAVDVLFVSVNEDTTQTTGVAANVTVTDQRIDGFVDLDLNIDGDDFEVSASFDGDFDVELDGGCAVGGELEVHAVARTRGQKASIWAKAEYGPGCEDVIVR